MSKRYRFFLIALTALTGLLAIGALLSDDASAEELTVNAWVPAKYAHTGDTIEIYAETSYNPGVEVDAYIYYYDNTLLESLNTYQIPETDKELMDTVSMEYEQGSLYEEDYWVAEYTIPDDGKGGVYGVMVEAKDGPKTAVDDAHSRLEGLMEDHVEPLQDAIIVFRDGDLQDTIDCIVEELRDFNNTLNDHGGVPGVAHDATDILEWDNLMLKGKSDQNMSDAAHFLEALLDEFLQSDEYLVLENFSFSLRDYFFDMNKNYLRDELTTSVYDALMYLIGFDEDKELMSYISQLDNTEDITAAYNTLKALEEYDNLKDSIEDIKNNVAPFYSAQEAMNASIELAYSDEFQELLEAFEEYLEDAGDYDPGNSPLQNLIYRSSEMDDDEMENLMDTQEFDDWMNALNESSLKEVLDAFNNTVENITDKLEELENSTQLEDLEEEMEDFGRFMEGVDEYYWEYFYPDDTYTHYFDVPDAEWLTTLEMDMWIYFEWDSDYGKLCINITDPEGTVYPYVFEVEEHGHYFSIYDEELDAVPGEWRIDVEANETAEGDYEIEIGSDEDEFGEYYLAETAEELFLVQNAGIAVQAPFVQEIGEQVEIKFAAYDDDGPLADEGLNALILYGDPLVRPQEEFDRSRGWYEYDGGGYEDIGGELYVNPYTTKLLLTMDIGDIEPDDTVTFTLTEPDGTTEHIYTYDHADSLEQDVYKEEIETSSVGEWDADIEVEGSDTGEGYVRLTVNYEPEPVIMPFWFASTQSFTRILSQETITTDANGIATLEIDVDEPGIYAYFVELPIASDEEYYAAAFGGFLGVEFTIDFGLEGLGTIMGIPVYRNTEGIGDTLELDITLSEAMDADMDVSVGPLDLSEAFENIELDYEEDDDELTFSNEQLQTAELEVNGPISFLGAVALSPDEDNVQKYSMAFGILLTSDVEVNITTDEILTPGGRHELDVETAEGTPESTYGAALLKSWLDTNSFDTAYLTSLIFAEMHGEMIEPEPWDAADDMQTIIYGEGNTAFADIPALLWDDDFMLLTITEVEIETESKLGVSFTEGKRVPPLALEVITTNPKVNQDIQVKVTSDGGPVEGATVTVTKGGVFVTTAATGSDGLAGFQVNEAGTYHLQAAKDSFIPDETDITVKEVLEIEVITSTPTANQSIEVKVTSDGEPVEGVTVRVSKGGVVITTAATNSSGVAEFQVNEAGTYHLKAAKDPYIPDELDITVRAEGSSERTFYLTFSKDELKEGEEFTVTIKDTENDEPIEGVEVKISKDGSVVKNGTTNSEGEVKFSLDKGSYTLTAEKTDYTFAEKQITVKESDEEEDEKGFIPGFGVAGFSAGILAAIVLWQRRNKG